MNSKIILDNSVDHEISSLLKHEPSDNKFNKFSGKSSKHWTRRIDWGLNGYFLFCIAAWLYFLQSLSPFFPHLYSKGEDAWMGLIGAILFLIESLMYSFGWYIDRQVHIERGEIMNRISESWNFWGNLLFVMGSIGYVITGIMGVMNCCKQANLELNLYLALLFIVDSILYTLGLFSGESSRVPRPESSVSWFRSSIDWYFLATVFFMIGSVLYFVSAVMSKLDYDSRWINIFAGLIFVIDGPLYLIAGLQFRDNKTPDPISPFRSPSSHNSSHNIKN